MACDPRHRLPMCLINGTKLHLREIVIDYSAAWDAVENGFWRLPESRCFPIRKKLPLVTVSGWEFQQFRDLRVCDFEVRLRGDVHWYSPAVPFVEFEECDDDWLTFFGFRRRGRVDRIIRMSDATIVYCPSHGSLVIAACTDPAEEHVFIPQ